MRIVLLSSTQFGYDCLTKGILPVKEVELVGILTTPKIIEVPFSEKPVIIQTHASFREFNDNRTCEVVELIGKTNSASYLQYIEKWQPDLLIALGWYFIVPKKVRQAVELGCVGIHASLLPKYRGSAPIPWAIINGEKITGISFFYLEAGIDTGDIITQTSFPISEDDTCLTIYEKATEEAVQALCTFLPLMANRNAPRTPQQEDLATSVPPRTPEDGIIDWNILSVDQAHNWVRAQTYPYPGAFTFWNGKKLVIWKSKLADQKSHESIPGRITKELNEYPNMFGVCCSDGKLLLVSEVSVTDNVSLPANVFLQKYKVSEGDLLQSSA